MGNLNCCAKPTVKDEKQPDEPHVDEEGAEAEAAPDEPAIKPHSATPMKHPLLGQALSTDITARYDLGDVIGRGAFATMRIATDKASGAKRACKSILKRRVEGAGDAVDVRKELDVMLHLAVHPNIVEVVDAFEDNAYVHIVMEYCEGGDLVKRIIDKGHYTERDAAAAIRTVLEVIAYSHDMGCMHRDIKPDNCLLADTSDSAPLKIADWGYADFFRQGQKLKGDVGTSFYMAPEVLTGPYGEGADVWSAGAMLYVLLSGRPPFFAVRDEDVFKKILEDGVPPMHEDPWPSISAPAKEAVNMMMTYDASIRPSARDMLAHAWVREGGLAEDTKLQPEVLHRLRGYASMNEFKRQAAMIIATHLPFDQIRGLQELFKSISDDDGTISPPEMARALELRGCKLPAQELAHLMALADENGDGVLDYSEWLATTLHQSRLQAQDNLLFAFRKFDVDGDGFISVEDARRALGEAGHGHRDAGDVVAAADRDGDGRIDYVEFVILMTGDASGAISAQCIAASKGGASPAPSGTGPLAPAADSSANGRDTTGKTLAGPADATAPAAGPASGTDTSAGVGGTAGGPASGGRDVSSVAAADLSKAAIERPASAKGS